MLRAAPLTARRRKVMKARGHSGAAGYTHLVADASAWFISANMFAAAIPFDNLKSSTSCERDYSPYHPPPTGPWGWMGREEQG